MELRHQIGIGISITLGTALILYLYNKISTPKPKPKPSRGRELIAKFNARPTAEDIRADNESRQQGLDEQASEGLGIQYSDMRYPAATITDHSVVLSDQQEGGDECHESGDDNMSVEDKEEMLPKVISESHRVTNAAAAVDGGSGVDSHEESRTFVSDLSEGSDSATFNSATLPTGEEPTIATNGAANLAASESATSESATTSTIDLASSESPTPATRDSATTSTNDITTPVSVAVVSNGISGGLPTTTQEFVRNVVRAKDRVEMSRKRSDTEIIQQIFNVPSKAVGKIIGKQGVSIKGVQRKSGARLQFPSNRDRNAPTQKLFVSGSLRQVEEAVALLVSLMPSDSLCHDLISWTPQIALSGDLHPMELIDNTVCIGRVTHVTSPDSVWIQICRGVTGTDYLSMLSTLTDNITETLGRKLYDLKSALIPGNMIKEGTSCAVMLEGRGYRGTVICPATPDNEVHQVRLVDFGTPHTFTELFNLNSYFYTMPALAIQCSLAHISKLQGDPIWPEGASEYLEESLAECFVKIRVVDTSCSPAKVEIYTEPTDAIKSTKYVNRELVYDGYASWVD